MKAQRKQLYVDSKVQGAIVFRVVSYWFFCVFFLTMPVVIAKTLTEPEFYFTHHLIDAVRSFWPIYATMFAILPFAVYDTLKMSNRFVGPVYRIRGICRQYNEDGKFRAIKFRKGDYWQDVADEINQAIISAEAKDPASVTTAQAVGSEGQEDDLVEV